jgi:uncharacterized protein YggL (DUF469 family)
MRKHPNSNTRLRHLNPRQRKKLRLGEFQELIFEVRVRFHAPLDEPAYEIFLDDFIDFLEANRLCVGGMGGRLPLLETDGMIDTWGRGSATEQHRQMVLGWLQSRAEVAEAEAGELVDGWYGWD